MNRAIFCWSHSWEEVEVDEEWETRVYLASVLRWCCVDELEFPLKYNISIAIALGNVLQADFVIVWSAMSGIVVLTLEQVEVYI